jgi:hypothetical protein
LKYKKIVLKLLITKLLVKEKKKMRNFTKSDNGENLFSGDASSNIQTKTSFYISKNPDSKIKSILKLSKTQQIKMPAKPVFR